MCCSLIWPIALQQTHRPACDADGVNVSMTGSWQGYGRPMTASCPHRRSRRTNTRSHLKRLHAQRCLGRTCASADARSSVPSQWCRWAAMRRGVALSSNSAPSMPAPPLPCPPVSRARLCMPQLPSADAGTVLSQTPIAVVQPAVFIAEPGALQLCHKQAKAGCLPLEAAKQKREAFFSVRA